MKTMLTFAVLYPAIFLPAYWVARRCDNSGSVALWIAAVAALYLSAMILVPGGQSEL